MANSLFFVPAHRCHVRQKFLIKWYFWCLDFHSRRLLKFVISRPWRWEAAKEESVVVKLLLFDICQLVIYFLVSNHAEPINVYAGRLFKFIYYRRWMSRIFSNLDAKREFELSQKNDHHSLLWLTLADAALWLWIPQSVYENFRKT